MKITFIPNSKIWEDAIPSPVSAKTIAPEWYKKQALLLPGEKKYGLIGRTANTTVKGCNPFGDSFSMGYIWCAPADIQIRKGFNEMGNTFEFGWKTEEELVTFHSADQIGNMPASYDGEKDVCKWSFDYGIKTPPGYSTLFTHPLNRHELPFRTFSGVVDTDTYHIPIHFPFQLLNLQNEITVIEKGTPLVQIIPIKREPWSSETVAYNESEIKKINFEYFSKIYRAYKSKHWHRKEYY
jgi:hypothetical protein